MRQFGSSLSGLEARDVVLLSVLGAVGDRGAALSEVVPAAKEIAPEDWQPTADVIAGCVVDAIDTGWIRATSGSEPGAVTRLEITPSGRKALRDLLCKPTPEHWGGLIRSFIAAKLCFLELLDPTERSVQVEALAGLYRDGLAALRCRAGAPPLSPSRPHRWLDHEIERFEWELSWLERLQADLCRAEAAQ